MKKIGFIDLFIDEWHANNYPQWFREAPRAGEFELGYAWEEKTQPGGRSLEKWCEDFRMTPGRCIEEVIEKSDCICVLAPSNPEVHERLADLPLRSGKPLYIDKPFADSRAAAERIFALAEKHGTPLMSSSALRFGDELISGKLQAMKPTLFSTTGGGRSFDATAPGSSGTPAARMAVTPFSRMKPLSFKIFSTCTAPACPLPGSAGS